MSKAKKRVDRMQELLADFYAAERAMSKAAHALAAEVASLEELVETDARNDAEAKRIMDLVKSEPDFQPSFPLEPTAAEIDRDLLDAKKLPVTNDDF